MDYIYIVEAYDGNDIVQVFRENEESLASDSAKELSEKYIETYSVFKVKVGKIFSRNNDNEYSLVARFCGGYDMVERKE